MKSSCISTFISATLLSCTVANADLIEVSTDYPTGTPLEVVAGQLSDELTVSIFNDTGADDSANLLAGWMISIEIRPEAGANGMVTIETPVDGVTASPTNYLFSTTPSSGIESDVNDDKDSVISLDFTSPTVGVQVPTSAVNLMTLTFRASVDALGTFGIFAIGGAPDSHWTDFGPKVEREFDNLAFGTSTKIGEISVVVPESSAALQLLCVCLLSIASLTLKRRLFDSCGKI